MHIPIDVVLEQVAARQKAADSKAKGGKLASSRNTGDGVIGGVVEATPLHEVSPSLDYPLFSEQQPILVPTAISGSNQGRKIVPRMFDLACRLDR